MANAEGCELQGGTTLAPTSGSADWWIVEMSLSQCDKAFKTEQAAKEYQQKTPSTLPKPPRPVWMNPPNDKLSDSHAKNL